MPRHTPLLRRSKTSVLAGRGYCKPDRAQRKVKEPYGAGPELRFPVSNHCWFPGKTPPWRSCFHVKLQSLATKPLRPLRSSYHSPNEEYMCMRISRSCTYRNLKPYKECSTIRNPIPLVLRGGPTRRYEMPCVCCRTYGTTPWAPPLPSEQFRLPGGRSPLSLLYFVK